MAALVERGCARSCKSGNLLTGELLVDPDFTPSLAGEARPQRHYPEIPRCPPGWRRWKLR